MQVIPSLEKAAAFQTAAFHDMYDNHDPEVSFKLINSYLTTLAESNYQLYLASVSRASLVSPHTIVITNKK